MRSQGGEARPPRAWWQRRPTPFDARLSAALVRRGLAQLSTTPLPRAALADLEGRSAWPVDNHDTRPIAGTAGRWPGGRGGDSPVAPLRGAARRGWHRSSWPSLAALCGKMASRSRRSACCNAPTNWPQRVQPRCVGPAPGRGETLIALGRPLDALRLIEGNDETAKRQRAFAFWPRCAYYQPSGRGRTSGRRDRFRRCARRTSSRGRARQSRANGLSAAARPDRSVGSADGRGPFPPLRTGNDAQTAGARFRRCAGSDVPEGSSAGPGRPGGHGAATAGPQRRAAGAVVCASGAAGRDGALGQRARQTMLYQVVALARSGQHDISLRRLNGSPASSISRRWMPCWGKAALPTTKARITLRGGDATRGRATPSRRCSSFSRPGAWAAERHGRGLRNKTELLDRGERGDLGRPTACCAPPDS